jgi:hypothetical protein
LSTKANRVDVATGHAPTIRITFFMLRLTDLDFFQRGNIRLLHVLFAMG